MLDTKTIHLTLLKKLIHSSLHSEYKIPIKHIKLILNKIKTTI